MFDCNPFSDLSFNEQAYFVTTDPFDDSEAYDDEGDCEPCYRAYEGCHIPDAPRDAWEAAEQLYWDRLQYGPGF